jgi:hydrogenase maturation protease
LAAREDAALNRQPAEREILVLALGNDLLGDDGVAWAAADSLDDQYGDRLHVTKTAECGLALLELMLGYRSVLILDAVSTGRRPSGEVFEIDPASLGRIAAPSPHYAGIPEVIGLAEELRLPIPDRISIVVMEVQDRGVVEEGLSEPVQKALPVLIQKAARLLSEWLGSES